MTKHFTFTMQYRLIVLLFIGSILYSFTVKAQNKTEFKFGVIKSEDFNISKYPVDTSLGGVILADIGNSSFMANAKGWFTLVYTHYRRIKILSKKGYDLANVQIPLYFQNNESLERVQNLKANTYTLENGKVITTKLSKDEIFTDQRDEHHQEKKFTFPGVRDGCILEYTYTVNSNFLFNLESWKFQGAFPRIISEYEVNIPSFFIYVTLTQGYNAFDINTTKTYTTEYKVNANSKRLKSG